jgi:hypothetical protein
MVRCQMLRKNKRLLLVVLSAATWLLIGQGIARAQDPFSTLIPQVPALREAIETDFPGAATPAYPFLHMPRFEGEVRITPLFYNLEDAKFLSPQDGLALDLKKDLGFVDQATLVEFTGRLQFNRLSVRASYDSYLRTLRGNNGNFTWPDLRVGMDLDLIQRPNTKLGIDMDACWQRPTFSVASPIFGDILVVGPRPVTFGIHGWYNPECIPIISPILELRYRWPIRTGTKIYEFEAAAGFKLPRTVLGDSGLRAGWRRTAITFDSAGHSVDITLSGIFVEYVFYH